MRKRFINAGFWSPAGAACRIVLVYLAGVAAPVLADEPEYEPEEEIVIDEERPIQADRPSFSGTPRTLRQARIQVEAGYTFTQDEEDGERRKEQSFPEVLVRVGLLDWLELRVDWNYLVAELDDGVRDTIDGAEDLGVGLKFALAEQDGVIPELGLITELTAPTGARAFTADKVTGGGSLLYEWEITRLITAAGLTGFHTVAQGDDDYLEFSQSARAGFNLAGSLGAYAEWFALFRSGAEDDTPEHYASGGVTYRVTTNLQLDARVGAGLNPDADDFFAGAGLAFRI
jgi:hypothetical protein